MRGAVLHGIGWKVGEHRMRRHYGIDWNVDFVSGYHPEDRKYVNIAGDTMCRGIFEWGVKMVSQCIRETSLTLQNQEIPYGYVHKLDVCNKYTEREWTAIKLNLVSTLYFCESKDPPKYQSSSSGTRDAQSRITVPGAQTLCKVTVDAKSLPASTVTKKRSPLGKSYYNVSYVLAIKFLTTLEFNVMCDEMVVGSVVADYI
jgi:hypothetical protein